MAVACHSVMLCQPVMCHRVMPAIVSGTCQNGRPSDRVLRASDSTPVSGPGLRLRPLGWILAGLRGCSVGPMPWTHGATLKRPCQGEFHGSAHGKGPSGEGRLGFGPRAHVGKPWPTENGPTWKARKPRSTGPRKRPSGEGLSGSAALTGPARGRYQPSGWQPSAHGRPQPTQTGPPTGGAPHCGQALTGESTGAESRGPRPQGRESGPTRGGAESRLSAAFRPVCTVRTTLEPLPGIVSPPYPREGLDAGRRQFGREGRKRGP